MTEQTAEWVLYAIAAVGVIVWLAGLRFLIASVQARKLAAQRAAEQLELSEPPNENLIYGSAEVTGRPDDLSTRAAAALAGGTAGYVGLLKILERTADRLTFERAGTMAGGHAGRSPVLNGQIRFTGQGPDRTRIDYAVQVAAGRGLLLGGVIFQILGLVALFVGFSVTTTFVVPNHNPAVRGQVFQMLQVGHFLWPPFLFGGIFRLRDRWVRDAFDALVHNLPHLKI